MEELLKLFAENPNIVKALGKEYIEKFKPLVYWVGSELLEVYKDYANNTELFKTTAKARKNQFDAYIGVGFSEEQAMILLFNDIENMKKAINNFSSSASKNKKEK